MEKFGLAEAWQVMVQRRKPHWPTVAAVLDILGIPNTVGAEVRDVVTELRGQAKATKEMMTSVESKDNRDKAETKESIKALKISRAQRAQQNTRLVDSYRRNLDFTEAHIRELEDFMKKLA